MYVEKILKKRKINGKKELKIAQTHKSSCTCSSLSI